MAASLARYKIVVFHHAAYSSAEHGPSVYMQWPFAAWGADVVLNGHDHSYERLNVDGIPYFVNGLGGKSLYTWVTIMAQSVFRFNADYGAQQAWADAYQIRFDFVRRTGVTVESFSMPSRYPSEVFPAAGTTVGDIIALFKADSHWFTCFTKTGKASFDVTFVPRITNPTTLTLEWQSRNDSELAYDSGELSYLETVQARNAVTNQWVTVLTTKVRSTPVTNSIKLPGNGQDYVDPATGLVQVRMNYLEKSGARIIRSAVSYLRLIAQ
jgi:hypothetical protein